MNPNVSRSVAANVTCTGHIVLRTQLEETRIAYHALMESLDDANWRRKTISTAWTVGEVMTHLADTLAAKPKMIASQKSNSWPKYKNQAETAKNSSLR